MWPAVTNTRSERPAGSDQVEVVTARVPLLLGRTQQRLGARALRRGIEVDHGTTLERAVR